MIRTIGLFLLLLLKILGWALLVLLLLLFTALLLVLFVPVRYDVLVQKERGMEAGRSDLTAGLRLQLKVNWLLHLMHVSVSYGPDGIKNKIRVAGFDIRKALDWLTKRRKRSQTSAETEETGQADAEAEEQLLESGSGPEEAETDFTETSETEADFTETAETEADSTETSETEADFTETSETEADSAETSETEVDSTETAEAEQEPEPEEKKRRKRSKQTNRKKVSKNVKQKKPSAFSKREKPGVFGSVRTWLGRIHKEFNDETNRHAVSRLWKEFFKLLQSYKPGKLKADISFSLADPALTGGATGLVSLLPFIYRYPCRIHPDFTSERLYIEGEFEARGKVAVYVFVLALLRLWHDKEFRKVVRRVMNKADR